MEVTIKIKLGGTIEQFMEKVKNKEPAMAAMLLEGELDGFNTYLQDRGMTPMGRWESQIVREYLGFKLVKQQQSE